MDLIGMLRRNARAFIPLAIFAYLGYIALRSKAADANTVVIAVGIGILFAIFLFKPKPPENPDDPPKLQVD